MTPSTEIPSEIPGSGTTLRKKPRFAIAIATALGVGYAPKAPGTFGSLVGVMTAVLSAVFFLHPATIRDIFSRHPLAEAVFADKHFLVPGSDIHNSTLALPLVCALALLVILAAIGVWSASQTADFAGIEDPQFVVIDEVAGQHLALILPLIPIGLPHLAQHFDFSVYAIFMTLSLVNWKYLLLGFLLFRLFDIWKPFPIRQLEKLPRGWGIMADDWMAGVYAAILLRIALHFGLLG
ncbi:MAG: phosphatidylglycerophosphatase A family protein [Candidatus Acidiferrum sp.]